MMVQGWLRFAGVLVVLLSGSPAKGAPEATDWLDLVNGAVALSATSEYNDTTWTALGLIDGTTATGWATKKGETGPNTILIELARPVVLREFVVDTRGIDGKGRGVGAFSLSGSSVSAREGFRPLLEGRVDAEERKVFQVQTDEAVRWLSLVAVGNQGEDGGFTEIMELEAYGDAKEAPAEDRVSGVYKTRYGLMMLEQDGRSIKGCYDYDEGTLTGDTDGRVLKFEWREVPTMIGSAIMVLDASGDRLNGLWYLDGALKGTWYGDRAPAGTRPQCTLAKGGSVEAALAGAGRAILYGVHFDTDSDRLRPESEAVLNDVAAALSAQGTWRVQVEGHTDAQGSDEYNRDLSNRRAKAVREWLVQHGIDPLRLESAGFGEDKPVADNSTPQGRALNRRVELSLKAR